ncbi:hypothetical protein PTNB85_10531 [Pyrenophora teres f. teres]|nr:hypothetical protein HRS9139_10507 [Pyrenophora teres f. teres]KAE8822085.1 hypothetical protein PTNB85_10531 [Pyrenophora teres f. teres]
MVTTQQNPDMLKTNNPKAKLVSPKPQELVQTPSEQHTNALVGSSKKITAPGSLNQDTSDREADTTTRIAKRKRSTQWSDDSNPGDKGTASFRKRTHKIQRKAERKKRKQEKRLAKVTSGCDESAGPAPGVPRSESSQSEPDASMDDLQSDRPGPSRSGSPDSEPNPDSDTEMQEDRSSVQVRSSPAVRSEEASVTGDEPCAKCLSMDHATDSCDVPSKIAKKARQKARKAANKAKGTAGLSEEEIAEKTKRALERKAAKAIKKAAKVQTRAASKGKTKDTSKAPPGKAFSADLSAILGDGRHGWIPYPPTFRNHKVVDAQVTAALIRAKISIDSLVSADLQPNGIIIIFSSVDSLREYSGSKVELKTDGGETLFVSALQPYKQARSKLFYTQPCFAYDCGQVARRIEEMMNAKEIRGGFIMYQKVESQLPKGEYLILFENQVEFGSFVLEMTDQVEGVKGFTIRCAAQRSSDPCWACRTGKAHLQCTNLRFPQQLAAETKLTRLASPSEAQDWSL